MNAPTDVGRLGVARGARGRLWVFWHDKYNNKIHAALTNTTATGWSKAVTLAGPRGTDPVWKIAGDGSLGPLDLVITAQVSGTTKLFYKRIPVPR